MRLREYATSIAGWAVLTGMSGISAAVVSGPCTLTVTAGLVFFGLFFSPLAFPPATSDQPARPESAHVSARYEYVTINGRLFIYDNVTSCLMEGNSL